MCAVRNVKSPQNDVTAARGRGRTGVLVLPPMLAAFAFALANVVLWWAVARWMDRRGIYLKV